MHFRYYLNPTPKDRNIEFDPKQNLIHNLQSFEQVRQPWKEYHYIFAVLAAVMLVHKAFTNECIEANPPEM